jgi:UDP-2,3-diacylglucosamine pyrophosphatase LpxH
VLARKLDILVISDLHLGTNACRASRLLEYLKSVEPKMLILNGDILDFWLLDAKTWPKKHTKILGYFFNLMLKEVPIYYLVGNHDDYLRKFTDFKFHNFYLQEELILDLNGVKTWILHGDKFDKSVTGSKRNIAIKAGKAFDKFVQFNRFVNEWEKFLGRPESNLSKKIKDATKAKIKEKNDFEQLYIDYAAKNGIDAVVCGHVHKPGIWSMCATDSKKQITYLNSGDWTESCTALEYVNKKWKLYTYPKTANPQNNVLKQIKLDAEEDLP